MSSLTFFLSRTLCRNFCTDPSFRRKKKNFCFSINCNCFCFSNHTRILSFGKEMATLLKKYSMNNKENRAKNILTFLYEKHNIRLNISYYEVDIKHYIQFVLSSNQNLEPTRSRKIASREYEILHYYTLYIYKVRLVSSFYPILI